MTSGSDGEDGGWRMESGENEEKWCDWRIDVKELEDGER